MHEVYEISAVLEKLPMAIESISAYGMTMTRYVTVNGSLVDRHIHSSRRSSELQEAYNVHPRCIILIVNKHK